MAFVKIRASIQNPLARRSLRLLSGLLLLCWSLLYGPATLAQSFVPGLIIQSKGDLYSWSKTAQKLTRLTQTGLNGNPVMSSDGKHVAFFAVPDQRYITCSGNIAVDFCNNTPLDVWLLDLETTLMTRITQRSPVVRASLTWSPDGQHFAWWVYPNEMYVYDLKTWQITRAAHGLPVPSGDAGFQGTAVVLWGPGGLAVEVQAATKTGQEVYVGLFTSSGTKRFEWHFNLDETVLDDLVWVYARDKPYLLGINHDNTYALLDPDTGKTWAIDPPPREHSISRLSITPAGADLRFQAIERTSNAAGRKIVDWLLSPDGADIIVREVDSAKSVATISCWCDNATTPIEIMTQAVDDQSNFPYGPEMTWLPLYVWLPSISYSAPTPSPTP